MPSNTARYKSLELMVWQRHNVYNTHTALSISVLQPRGNAILTINSVDGTVYYAVQGGSNF